jgi:hypothetical protein
VHRPHKAPVWVAMTTWHPCVEGFEEVKLNMEVLSI